MADEEQIRIFTINTNIIDGMGTTNADELVDKLAKKIEEMPGFKVQHLSVNLQIQVPNQSVMKNFEAPPTNEQPQQ